MRRGLFIVLLCLGVAATCLWIYGYIYIHGLACAFGNVNGGPCPIRMPWELVASDRPFMVYFPLVLIFAIFGSAFLVRPRRR